MNFNPDRVALVDTIGGNRVVRGCTPNTDGAFDYRGIRQALGLAADPSKFFVVSLMDNVGERDEWKVDFQAYGKDPEAFPVSSWPPYVHVKDWTPGKAMGATMKSGDTSIPGSLYWWPIEGLPPGGDPREFVQSGWNFAGCVELLCTVARTSWLVGDSLVYFHCRLGADRTGALHAGYLVRTNGMGARQALDKAGAATTAGLPSVPYQNLVTAYAAALGR